MAHFWRNSVKRRVYKYLEENVEIKISKPQDAFSRLTVKKTIGGDLLIDDDLDFYIFVLPLKKKIVTIPKEYGEKFCTEKQVAFYDYLVKNGVIMPNAVQGGDLYGSFEVVYDDKELEGGTLNFILNIFADFIEEENQYRSIDIEDVKNRLMRMVGRDSNETDPEEVLGAEKRMYGFGKSRSNFGISSMVTNVNPVYGTYYFE